MKYQQIVSRTACLRTGTLLLFSSPDPKGIHYLIGSGGNWGIYKIVLCPESWEAVLKVSLAERARPPKVNTVESEWGGRAFQANRIAMQQLKNMPGDEFCCEDEGALKMDVSVSRFILKPHLHYDGIWKWGNWEGIRSLVP